MGSEGGNRTKAAGAVGTVGGLEEWAPPAPH